MWYHFYINEGDGFSMRKTWCLINLVILTFKWLEQVLFIFENCLIDILCMHVFYIVCGYTGMYLQIITTIKWKSCVHVGHCWSPFKLSRLAVLFLVMVLFVFPSRSQELLKWTEYDLQIWYSPAMARIVVWFESAIWDLLKFPDSKHILICNENSQFSNFLQILSLVCWKRKWYYDLLPRILNLWRV